VEIIDLEEWFILQILTNDIMRIKVKDGCNPRFSLIPWHVPETFCSLPANSISLGRVIVWVTYGGK
jgi:hypothetical protein